MKLTTRDKYLLDKYGITVKVFDEMMKVNKGGCWICGRIPITQRLNVDHDHKTGQVRGLLCPGRYQGCNRKLIGNYRREHAILFERAASYLRNEFDWRNHIANEDKDAKKYQARAKSPKGVHKRRVSPRFRRARHARAIPQ